MAELEDKAIINITRRSSKKAKKQYQLAVMPRQFGMTALFPAEKQTESREVPVRIDGRLEVWKIGGEPPVMLSGGRKLPCMPALSIEHCKAYLSLYSFYRSNNIPPNSSIRMSMRMLCESLGMKSSSAQNIDAAKRILGDLDYTYISVGELAEVDGTLQAKKGKISFNLIRVTWGEDESGETFIKRIYFDPEFLKYLDEYEKILHIRVDVLNSLRSNIAEAIYMYIPSRAIWRKENDPFLISTSTLLSDIGKMVPPHKSLRYNIFARGNKTKSIIEKLDKAEIAFNKRLRVGIKESTDKKDYNLLFWTEDVDKLDAAMESSLFTWYMSGIWFTTDNRSEEIFRRKTAAENLPLLDEYEIQALTIAKINIKTNDRFLRMSKALLESDFTAICGEVKCKILEDAGIRNSTAYLIGKVRIALSGELLG